MGRIVLDRNPKNYFAEVEQIAFCPSNMVPGVEPSPDKMLQVCVSHGCSHVVWYMGVICVGGWERVWVGVCE